jgi:CHAT domain-containing protein/tetratricopeptide (TPR) repeat protein
MRAMTTRAICGVTFLLLLIAPLPLQFPLSRCLVSQAKSVSSSPALTGSKLLSTRKQIQRTICARARHTYSFPLTSGQFLRAMVTEENVDLKISLSGPNLNKLLVVNSRLFGPTPISCVADVAGIYRLEVQAVRTDTDAGRYKLSVEAQPDASPKDLDTVVAEKLFSEGEELSIECKPNSLSSAIAKYEEAIGHWRSADKLEDVALALKNIGDAYMLLSENEKAPEYYHQALELSQKVGNRPLEIEALNGIGFIENDRGAPAIALDYCNRARSLSREIAFRRGEAQSLNNIGLTYYNSGDVRRALDLFEQSLAIWATAVDRRGQAQTLLNVGYAHNDLGETAKARNYFDQALSLARKTKDYKVQVLSLAVLGLSYTWSGDKQSAFDAYTQALELARSVGDRFGEAVSLNGLGYYYDDLGKEQTALENYLQAAQLFKDIGNRSYEVFTLGFAGHISFAMGDTGKALEYYNRHLELCRSLPNPRQEAYGLRDIGAIYASLGRTEEAISNYESALALSKEVGDPRGQAYILNRQGLIYSRLKNRDKAQECFDEGLRLLLALEDRSGEVLILYNMACLRRDLGELTQASNLIQTALQVIERLRTTVISEDLRASYLASVYECYELYIDLLMRMHKQNPESGFDRVAFVTSERGRARSLLEMLKEARADIHKGIGLGLLQKARSTQELLNAKADRHMLLLGQRLAGHSSAENGGKSIDEEIAALADEIKQLDKQSDEIEAVIRISSPGYAALTQPRSLSLKQLQHLLDRDTVLVEYSLGEERSYVWAVTKSSLVGCELPPRKDIEQVAQDFHRLVATQQASIAGETYAARAERIRLSEAGLNEAAGRLSEMILKPIAPYLGTNRLVIVPDGALHYVPFAALPDPKDASGKVPLVVNHKISNLPSLSTLATLRKECAYRRHAEKTLVVLADAVYDRDDNRITQIAKARLTRSSAEQTRPISFIRSFIESPDAGFAAGFHRLPFSGREAREISQFVPRHKRKVALDFNASLRLAMSADLDQYRIIHFAAHGFLSSEHPKLSGIVLSLVDEQGNPQDGFLRLNEIYNMKLRADLVVLSACQTAIGKQIMGEGIIGLTRGFMYAGAARVTATLWKVDDNATSELMKRFYAEMLTGRRLRPSDALRAAQLQMIKQPQWKSPYYWAAFVLQGEWK